MEPRELLHLYSTRSTLSNLSSVSCDSIISNEQKSTFVLGRNERRNEAIRCFLEEANRKLLNKFDHEDEEVPRCETGVYIGVFPGGGGGCRA